jgi:hypothetical protein
MAGLGKADKESRQVWGALSLHEVLSLCGTSTERADVERLCSIHYIQCTDHNEA